MNEAKDDIALSCRNLSFSYGKKAPSILNNVTFDIKKGEAVVLMGPSGCGKSTLAYCLSGLYPDYAGTVEGEIYVGDAALGSLSPSQRAKRISIMFQNPDNQFCMGRADHEILFALENINYLGDMNARMCELWRLVGLEGFETAPIHTLSGGTKQNVALATALATEADILILDEPFANIDPKACQELSQKLAQLNKAGLTLFIVDHRLNYWRSFMSRVMFMDSDGSINETGIYPDDLENRKSEFSERGLSFGNEWMDGQSPIIPPLPAESIIEISNLNVSYGKKTVLNSLSLTVQSGTISALTGDNGSGKSTLLWTIAGLKKYSGSQNISAKTGLVFQNPRFQFLTLKVKEEILFTLKHAIPSETPANLSSAADELLDEFGLLQYANASPYTLSQGQQRRLAILTMLAGDRPVLLLDEPTYAQDERATRFIMDLLKKRVTEGLTVIMATHDHALASAYANNVYNLKDGKV